MESLEARIAALSPEQRAMLEKRMKGRSATAVSSAIPARDPGQTVLPLSSSQQRLWFLEQLEPGHSLYNLPIVARLQGQIRVSKLEESLNAVVARHEVLRTKFALADGEPHQVIAPFLEIPLAVVDLSAMDDEEREQEAARLTGSEAATPFDLSTGPLLRASLLRMSNEDHILILNMHHIVSDGWSMNVLYREISTLYDASCRGRPSPLQPLPIQFADYAIWQRSRLASEALRKQLDYWRKQMADSPALLELPADRPRQTRQDYLGASYLIPLDRGLVADLRRLAKQTDTTLFMVLLAAYQVLLHRYSGARDIVVGSPIANRGRAEIEELIGFFVNTLLLRVTVDPAERFVDFLRGVREITLQAFSNQDVPFERLVEELSPERNLAHNPLFQVAFGLQNNDTTSTGAQPSGPQLAMGTSKFDLTLSVTETAEDLTPLFEYNTQLFDHGTIAAFAANYETLLRDVADAPERVVKDLLRPSGAARRELVDKWNRQTATSLQNIHQLYEQRAEDAPDAVAIEYGDESLTYSELNCAANRLARWLGKQGVEPGQLVALCLDRSPEILVGMLGVLKSGAAFLPLDPSYPQQRLQFMLDDTAAPLMLTSEHLLEKLPRFTGRVACFEELVDQTAPLDSGNLPRVPGNALAYVIYTSGSTGRPKGVMVEHAGVCNVVEQQQAEFGLGPASRVLQFCSFGFDTSIFEMLLAAGAGGTLVVAPLTAIIPGEPLAQVLRNERITVLVIPPSSLALLPEAPFPDLEVVVAAGEACPGDLVRRWVPGRRFLNGYGPTEASIWTSLADCVDGTVAPPIGHSISNVRAYVLDADMEPVPPGVPGELWLGGICVSRGYLGCPGLTAERFLPDPFGPRGQRVYRSGDRVRRLADGQLQFLGRFDDQVKLRGYRVELGEIEHTLMAHQDVREAAVLVETSAAGDPRLVACFVPVAGSAVGPTELKGHLAEHLAGYMVPAFYCELDALPRNNNGKLDRHALPAMVHERLRIAPASHVAPRTAAERQVASTFEAVLEVENVGAMDGFFDLGGHSLLATRVVARINELFNIRFPLRSLFEQPTVAEIAAEVERMVRQSPGRGEPELTPLRRVPVAMGDAAQQTPSAGEKES